MYIFFEDCTEKRFSHKDGWATIVEKEDYDVEILIKDGLFVHGVYRSEEVRRFLHPYTNDGVRIYNISADSFFRGFRSGKIHLY